MPKRFLLPATLAFALSIGSAAGAAAACNIDSNNCLGYLFSGPTSQGGGARTDSGGVIQFVTDLQRMWVGRFQFAIAREHCKLFRGNGFAALPINLDNRRFRVIAGHFSTTQTSVSPRPLPSIQWHLTGALADDRASGTVSWSFVGPNEAECAPSSGRFTWKVTNRGKVASA